MHPLNLIPRGVIAAVAARIARAATAAASRTSRKNAPAFPVSPWYSYDAVSGATWAPRDYTAFAREGFMQNAVVYRCVRMIAEAAASVPFALYDGAYEVDDHPLLRLLARPTPTTTRAELFEAYFGFLLVSGNAYLEATSLGEDLRELHILRPDRIVVVPGEDGYPEAYDYSVDGSRPVRLDGECVPGVRRVLHHKLFHPLNDHYGLSPIEAAATAIDIHNAASRWNKSLLDNSARPSGALVYASRDGNLTTEQYNRLKNELESQFQGAGNAGRPLLLEGGLDWKSMSMSPKDLDFIEAKHGAAREIALALGVPPMLLGIPGDNTFSNYQEANRTFWRQTVLPLVQRTTAALAEWLAPAYGPTLVLKADLDDLDALSSERDAQWSRLNATTFLTDDEKRAAVGYGPKPQEANKLFNPNQPRDSYGRWAPGDGAEVVPAQTGRRRGWSNPSVQQQQQLDFARQRAQDAVRQVQQQDPTWRPPVSVGDGGIEAEIAHHENVEAAANARLAEIARTGVGGNGGPPLQPRTGPSQTLEDILLPGGSEVGMRERGAGPGIRTVTAAEFDALKAGLLDGAKQVSAPPRYDGSWYQRPDGTVFGLRSSSGSGPTIEVVQGTSMLNNGYKVHSK